MKCFKYLLVLVMVLVATSAFAGEGTNRPKPTYVLVKVTTLGDPAEIRQEDAAIIQRIIKYFTDYNSTESSAEINLVFLATEQAVAADYIFTFELLYGQFDYFVGGEPQIVKNDSSKTTVPFIIEGYCQFNLDNEGLYELRNKFLLSYLLYLSSAVSTTPTPTTATK